MKRVLKGLINAVLSAFFVILRPTHCSDIFAELDHRLNDYCSDQRLCQDTGNFIHIVCQYYGKTGSSCSGFREVPLDKNIVNEILYRINTMRMHVAKGEAMGKNQRKLPQAYGMKKIFWDSELAAFAQIMISQCLGMNRHSCAATKNFSNTLMAYTFGNTTSSATAIIENIFSIWRAAAPMTRDEVFLSPDLKGRDSQFYIKMVVGNVSHVGCAIGVYEHEMRPLAIEAVDYNDKQLFGHIICYFSHFSRRGTPVYNTTAPVKGTGWTKCGCPPKYRETKECLCVPTPRTGLSTKQQTATRTANNMSFPTISAHTFNDNYEKYISDMRQIYDAMEKEQKVSTIQLLDWKTEQKLESTTPINLKHETRVRTPVPTCNGGEKSDPKIVMLPIFSIKNYAPKELARKRGSGYYRRSGNTSLLQTTAQPIDDLSLSDENNDGLPKNISQSSELLQTVTKRKIGNKEGVHSFSYDEQNVEPDHQIMEHSQHTVKPFERILEAINLVETTTKKYKRHDRNEKAKKRVNNLLDLLEKKGKKAQLNSREMIEFGAKMRRIYKTVLGTHEHLQFEHVAEH